MRTVSARAPDLDLLRAFVGRAPEPAAGRENYGHTKSGVPITDGLVEELADEAERGFDVEEPLGRRGKRGRPPIGSGPATVESVRLDPELRRRLARRVEEEGVSVSEIIREALRQHLEAS